MRIAVIGTGIAGTTCVELLRRRHDVVVFEAEPRPGGHTNTVDVAVPEGQVAADTGFLVYTERAYPLLTRLFARLAVPTQPADMSFSVRDEATGREWRGTSPATVFAQPANALRPDFWRMLVDVARFNRAALRLLGGDGTGLGGPRAPGFGGEGSPAGGNRDGDGESPTLRQLVASGRWSRSFVDGYLVPIGSAIWSADPHAFLDMPARTFAAFFDRHGLLRFGDQAPWRTVTGGARRYVDTALRPLRDTGRLHLGQPVHRVRRTEEGVELAVGGPGRSTTCTVDQVVVATHSDQALALLADPDPLEAKVLGAMRYQANRAVLHTDTALLPRRQRARASWNYHLTADTPDRAAVTYDVTRLQRLPTTTSVLVTLNREDAVDPDRVVAAFDYAHPVVDAQAVDARSRHDEVNGRRRTWYCGAYWGDGFHEDGVHSAVAVCRQLGGEPL